MPTTSETGRFAPLTGRAVASSAVATLALVGVLALGGAEAAAAHDAGPAAALTHGARAAGGDDVKLRRCWLTVAMAARPADEVRGAFRPPLELTQTFYGADALVGIWGMSCRRARVEGERLRRVTVSVVSVPTGLAFEGALPVANNFVNALLRVDTNSRRLARALRRSHLPARRVRRVRFEHSRREVLPARGELAVRGRYRIEVSASDLDPTNPHDHANRFNHVRRNGRTSTLGLSIDDAFDRFCFPAVQDCTASTQAPRKSPLRDLLGRFAPAQVGFDHARIKRIDLHLGVGNA